jgi:hypothetical protein
VKYRGNINYLDSLVIKDPFYSNEVPLQYNKKNLDFSDAEVHLDIKNDNENFCYNIKLLIFGKDPSSSEMKSYEIGMDSACIAIGADLNADEIKSLEGEWQPNCALRTGADGYFGCVTEFLKLLGHDEVTKEPIYKVNCIALEATIDEEMYIEEELVDYFKEQLHVQNLVNENGSEREM